MLMGVSVRVLKGSHGRVDAVIQCTGKRHLGNLPTQQLAVLRSGCTLCVPHPEGSSLRFGGRWKNLSEVEPRG